MIITNNKLLKWPTNIPQKAIKLEEKSFDLRGESKKSVNFAQSCVHLKIAKND